MNCTPRRSALSRADLVDAIACGFPDGETLPDEIRYLAGQLHLSWQPPTPQETKPDQPLPEPSFINAETGKPPDMVETPLLDVTFWRVESYEHFADDSEEAQTRTKPKLGKYEGWRGRPSQPPRFQPLATWPELAPRLRQVLSDYREGRAIDMGKTIWHISRGDVLEYFPHERRRRWGPSLLLIEDDSRRLIPYRADKRLVREAVRCLLPTHALSRAIIDDGLDRPFLVGGEPDDWPPPPGTLVLALGDLGCLAVQGSVLRQRWQDIGLELLEAGCHPLALFPAPAARCPPELAKVWRVIPWERPRLTDDGDRLAERAERLLRLVAPASRIEPGLLRAARLLLPADQADASTEADVWQHPSLISDSAAGATLSPTEAQKLRLAFSCQEHPDIRLRLIHLLKVWRRGLPEEIWYDELLNFDPDSILADDDLAMDLDDARRYFAKFCEENPGLSADTMPAGDRAWLARIQARSTGYIWKDEMIGARLAELAMEITSEIPLGIHPGDIPAPDQPERRVHLFQIGNVLSVIQDLSEALLAGSLLTDVSTRNGLIEFEPLSDRSHAPRQEVGRNKPAPAGVSGKTEGQMPETVAVRPYSGLQLESEIVGTRENGFWETGEPPSWASDWGWDEYGAWVEFVVDGEKDTLYDGSWSYDGSIDYSGKKAISVTQRMRWIAPGTFMMGSPKTEAERSNAEGLQHTVNIQQGYWLFDTACTQALWEVVMGGNLSNFKGADRPVERVSWNDTQKFIQALNQKGLDLSLPSEAQWEYACRAGTITPFSFGGNITTEQVNYQGEYPYAGGKKGQYRKETVPVKSLPANPWGLYEMHGNVWEWVQDAWHGNYQSAPTDGSVWESVDAGAARVLRGGSWGNYARDCRSAFRYYYDPDLRYFFTGFRCARIQNRESGKPAAGQPSSVGRNKPVLSEAERPAPADVSGKTAGQMPETVVARPYSGLLQVEDIGCAERSEAHQPDRLDGAPFDSDQDRLRPSAHPMKDTFAARLLRLATTPNATVPLPQAKAFAILTDREKLTLRQTQKPKWAKSIGRDRFGLCADIAVESKQGEPVIQRLRWIPPGRFMMGSKDDPGRYDDEGPQHSVTIAQGYWLFDTPCTQDLWQAVMGKKNRSRFKDGNKPVEQVSWNDAQQFIQALNQCSPGLELSLPSEAQWEYACRAGTTTPFSFGGNITPEQVNYDGNNPYAGGKKGQYRNETIPVKSLSTNPWGLYEMHGNVREWVQDAWHDNYNGAPTDGSAWVSAEAGAARVVRGGSWLNDARNCRSASRSNYQPDYQYYDTGFRCARVQA